MSTGRWSDAIQHRGDDVASFFGPYFGQADRRVLLVAAAGFDPRSCMIVEELAPPLGKRLDAILVREERPERDEGLRPRAERSLERFNELVDTCRVIQVDVFALDGAPVLGRSAVEALSSTSFGEYTDIVLDFSALSIGASFPIAAFAYQSVRPLTSVNLHLVVAANSAVDEIIQPVASDRVAPVHGFKGGWNTAATEESAKLWIPQLASGQRAILERIRREVDPDDIAPIVPFPARHPRVGDDLLSEYRAELNEAAWGIDARDLVYAEENNPLDLYRTILAMDDRRGPVFAEVGGSMVVLSPVGSKVQAMGAMMAALERNMPVLYAESVGFEADFRRMDAGQYIAKHTELVHVWLHGDVYREGPLGRET